MKPGIPWSVKGIEPEVREAAKYAARRSGLSLGEWLNGIILEQAETDDEDEDDHYEPPRRQATRGERLGRVSERLGRMDQQNQHTAAGRLMGRERGPDPRLVSDVLERLAASERRTETAFETITERLEELAQQISTPRPGDTREDDPGFRAVESAIRNIVSHMEVNEKRTRDQLADMQGKLSRTEGDGGSEAAIRRLDQRIQELTRRLDRTDSGEQAQELLSVMESHIARVNERIDLIRQPSVAEMSRTRADIALLKERMDALQENTIDASAVTVLKADIQTMSDALRVDLARVSRRADQANGETISIEAETELAQQVADLHARLTVAEEQLVQVSVLERSISEIIGRLDETSSGFGPSPELSALEAALNSVAESSRNADERTQATLQAVHETLEQITSKIAAIEADTPQAENVDTGMQSSVEMAEPHLIVSDTPAAAWQNVLRSHVTGPAYTAPMSESGSLRADPATDMSMGEPLRAIRLDQEPLDTELPQLARTEDYVAAARRAALAAQHAEAGAPKSRASKQKTAEKAAPTRRRKLLMAAIVLLMAVSAFTVAGPKLMNRALPQATEPGSPATVPAPSLQSEPTNPNKSSMLPPQSGMVAGDSIADLLDQADSDTVTSSVVAKPAIPGFTDDFGPASLRKAALGGDPAAQFVTATRYLEGKGTAPDAQLAAKWFGEAASHGLAPAQYRLATLYELGRGLQRNLIAARDLYERAAAQGNVKAMHNLAVLLSSGEADTKPDYAKALSWFEQAARHGLPDSQFNLAVLYDRGAGTEADAVKAAFWYGVLAAKGDADAAAKARALAPRLTSSERKKVASDIAAFRAKPAKVAANQISVSDPAWQGEDATSSINSAQTPPATAAQVKEAQRLLTLLGYTAGRADGKLSDKTANAIRIFQLQNGLPVNGMVDAVLIGVLRDKTPG
jgi:localization factor PodJL